MRINVGGAVRLAVYLTAFFAAVCTWDDTSRSANAFSYQLSRQIERLVRAHSGIKRQKEETESGAQPPDLAILAMIAPPLPASPSRL